jgi:excinuclease ABC subunit B
MYADRETASMHAAITETNRRRGVQSAYNEANGIVPKTIVKGVRDLIEIGVPDKLPKKKGEAAPKLTKSEKAQTIERLTREMKEAAKLLEFEKAAFLRDEIKRLENE